MTSIPAASLYVQLAWIPPPPPAPLYVEKQNEAQWRSHGVTFRTTSAPESHLQGEDGGDGFVVADGILHVTPVIVLCHFGPAGQAWNGAALPGAGVRAGGGGGGGGGGSETPEDPVSPGRFTLLPTERKNIFSCSLGIYGMCEKHWNRIEADQTNPRSKKEQKKNTNKKQWKINNISVWSHFLNKHHAQKGNVTFFMCFKYSLHKTVN